MEQKKYVDLDGLRYYNTMLKENMTFGRYSADETIIGTWIDGKPIYRTVIVYEANGLGNVGADGKKNYWAYYKEMAKYNISQYTRAYGMALCYSKMALTEPLWQPIPRICPDACEEYSIGIGDLNTGSIGVLFGTNYTSATIYFTIEYTKNE